jgi:hypothetical protein
MMLRATHIKFITIPNDDDKEKPGLTPGYVIATIYEFA